MWNDTYDYKIEELNMKLDRERKDALYITGTIMKLSGIGILVYTVGWLAAAGVVLIYGGNNGTLLNKLGFRWGDA